MAFPETSWSMLAVATLHGDEFARRALDELCRRYWQPVYAVIRSREFSEEYARDQTQAFFVYLLAKSALRKADRAKGRFRTFLLTLLWRFVRDERKQAAAQKRGGGLPECSLEETPEEPAAEANPLAEILDREWALATLERALETIRREVIHTRGETAWTVLKDFLPGSAVLPSMSLAATTLGVGEGGARTEVHRLRQRCREILRRELMLTVSAPDELNDEIEYLGRVLRNAAQA